MLMEISEKRITGILHTAGATRISRYQYALNLAEILNLLKDLVKPAKMNEIQWKAQRPKDSSLNINKAATLLDQKPLELFKALETMQNEKKPTRSQHRNQNRGETRQNKTKNDSQTGLNEHRKLSFQTAQSNITYKEFMSKKYFSCAQVYFCYKIQPMLGLSPEILST